MPFNLSHIPSKPVAPIFKKRINLLIRNKGSKRQPGAFISTCTYYMQATSCQPICVDLFNFQNQLQMKNTRPAFINQMFRLIIFTIYLKTCNCFKNEVYASNKMV